MTLHEYIKEAEQKFKDLTLEQIDPTSLSEWGRKAYFEGDTGKQIDSDSRAQRLSEMIETCASKSSPETYMYDLNDFKQWWDEYVEEYNVSP